MSQELVSNEKQSSKRPKPDVVKKPEKKRPVGPGPSAMLRLQRSAGNRAVQRLLAQRQAAGDGFELDETTANRINEARGSGQALDNTVQTQMSQSMGYDFSGVRVHTGSEADELNQQLSARAFTTGQDIFFRQGEYTPSSSGGQELIAHELTHVVQQGSGQVGGGSGMTVRPAGDAFEQEADAMAQKVVSAGSETGSSSADGSVQRQEDEDELQFKRIQRQEDEDELQFKRIQRQEDEEEVQLKSIQRQEDEDELQFKRIQRQENEEEIQTKLIQRQEDEEEIQTKPIQRQGEEEEIQA